MAQESALIRSNRISHEIYSYQDVHAVFPEIRKSIVTVIARKNEEEETFIGCVVRVNQHNHIVVDSSSISGAANLKVRTGGSRSSTTHFIGNVHRLDFGLALICPEGLLNDFDSSLKGWCQDELHQRRVNMLVLCGDSLFLLSCDTLPFMDANAMSNLDYLISKRHHTLKVYHGAPVLTDTGYLYGIVASNERGAKIIAPYNRIRSAIVRVLNECVNSVKSVGCKCNNTKFRSGAQSIGNPSIRRSARRHKQVSSGDVFSSIDPNVRGWWLGHSQVKPSSPNGKTEASSDRISSRSPFRDCEQSLSKEIRRSTAMVTSSACRTLTAATSYSNSDVTSASVVDFALAQSLTGHVLKNATIQFGDLSSIGSRRSRSRRQSHSSLASSSRRSRSASNFERKLETIREEEERSTSTRCSVKRSESESLRSTRDVRPSASSDSVVVKEDRVTVGRGLSPDRLTDVQFVHLDVSAEVDGHVKCNVIKCLRQLINC